MLVEPHGQWTSAAGVPLAQQLTQVTIEPCLKVARVDEAVDRPCQAIVVLKRRGIEERI
jgi:hypothetical protein